jgi:hypothetical protein
VSVATLRVLQHGSGQRRVQDATLAAVCRALEWPANNLLRVLHGQPLAEFTAGPTVAAVDTQAEILAVLRRIEAHVEGIARQISHA